MREKKPQIKASECFKSSVCKVQVNSKIAPPHIKRKERCSANKQPTESQSDINLSWCNLGVKINGSVAASLGWQHEE